MTQKAIENGVLNYVSASQIKTFERCNRKWFIEKRFSYRSPSSKAQETGSSIHTQVEKYYKEGTPPEHPSALLAVQNFLPVREKYLSGELLVEWPGDISKLGVKIAGVPVYGRIDLLDLSNDSYATVIDLKSLSDFKYSKSSEDLARDLQLSVYGLSSFAFLEKVAEVKLEHVYIHTRGTGAMPSNTFVSPLELYRNVGASAENVHKMYQLAAETDYRKVEPNWLACNDYNKQCPFYGVCKGLQTVESLFSPVSDTTEAPDSSPTSAPKKRAKKSAKVKFTAITVKRGVTLNKGSFNSLRADVEVSAEVDGDLDEAYETVAAEVRKMLDLETK